MLSVSRSGDNPESFDVNCRLQGLRLIYIHSIHSMRDSAIMRKTQTIVGDMRVFRYLSWKRARSQVFTLELFPGGRQTRHYFQARFPRTDLQGFRK